MSAPTPSIRMLNMQDIRADIGSARKTNIYMYFCQSASSWTAEGSIELRMPMGSVEAGKLSAFFVDNSRHWPSDPIVTLVDVANNRHSQLNTNGGSTRRLSVRYNYNIPRKGWSAFGVKFDIETDYTPYDNDKYSSVAQWLRERTSWLINKVVTELAAAAGINGGILTVVDDDDDDYESDKMEYSFMRHIACILDEQPIIAVEICIQDRPEFIIWGVAAAINARDEKTCCMLEHVSKSSQALVVSGHPVYFREQGQDGIYSGNLPTKARDLDDHDSNMWADEDAVPLAEGGREFVMDKDKSAGFVSYVNQQIMMAEARYSDDELHKQMEHIVADVAKQLRNCLKE